MKSPIGSLRQRLYHQIRPGQTRILKSNGLGKRVVTSNDGHKIAVRTGVRTRQTKAVTYEMIEFAADELASKGSFTSLDFRRRFDSEYRAAPCRFSVTGGILVELGLAELASGKSASACVYIRPRG